MPGRAYYPAQNELSLLGAAQRAVKIARHSSCAICADCPGLRPPPGLDVVLDSEITALGVGGYGSEDEEDDDCYLETCACGHTPAEHQADEATLGAAEFARKSRVAVRLDDHLQQAGKLLDFNYSDDEIAQLKRTLDSNVSTVGPPVNVIPSPRRSSSPASSILSDPPTQPPAKRRRIASLSDSSEDDENTPLAVRMGNKPTKPSEKSLESPRRTGKNPMGPGRAAKKGRGAPSNMAPQAAEQPLVNGLTNGINGSDARVKVEDVMDEGQLTRLAAGTTVDTANGTTPGQPPVKTEKMAIIELRKGVIRVVPVENDHQPRSLVILTGLKTLFQKQLPNMPREYIARLVYDSNSRGLAIIKRGYKVVGGICFRPFPHRGFAEIVFFATNSADQEKGYGGMLMDHFKAHIVKTYPGMMHFLTYADNYAVGYFEKQGFSKEISLDRSVWAAYIKDYEGGTIMQCTMVRKVDYLDKPNIFAQQQEAIMTKIRQNSKSHIIHPGLPQFQDGAGEGVTVDPKDVPGLRESGWTPGMESVRPTARSANAYYLERILKELKAHGSAWAFLTPVSRDDVPDYYDTIADPMDLGTMEHKLETKQYSTIDSFLADAQLIFDNCRQYNQPTSIWYRNADKLEAHLKDELLEKYRR